jgi:AGZA family xanthine/uracil permease-like MFS transporter
MIERLFHLKEHDTDVKTEVIAGITTFLTMAYIIFVQPAVISMVIPGARANPAYQPFFDAVLCATCLAAALSCLLNGFLANLPIALAPGMGENFFFVFNVVLAKQATWQEAFGIVFIAGALFFLITLTRAQRYLMDVLPPSLKNGVAVGIGLFIALIGLFNAGIVVRHPAPNGLIAICPHLMSPPVLLALFGLFVTCLLLALRVRAAILLGILATLLAALATGLVRYAGILASPPNPAPTFMKMEVLAVLKRPELYSFILIFLFMDLFDTMGTLVGVGTQAGLMKDGKLPRAGRALFTSAVGTASGGVMGTTTVVYYIESAAGVQAGGRTGLMPVVTGILFLVALFFKPLAQMVGGGFPFDPATGAYAVFDPVKAAYVGSVDPTAAPFLYPITASALIIVGSMMLRNVREIDFDDFTEYFPAFLIIVGIPFFFSIAEGLALGFIAYPILKLVSGKARECHPILYAVGVIIFGGFLFMHWKEIASLLS